MIRFRDGQAEYRNRFVRTAGFAAEQDAGHALWSGILGGPDTSLRDDGWGARTRMKDASSTDVVVHAGRALTSFYQCGDLYGFDPCTLEAARPRDVERRVPARLGHLRAHEGRRAHRRDARVQLREGRAVHALRRRRRAPTTLVHWIDVPLPGPRLPHDMAFTEHYAILNDCPLFWDADFLAQGRARAALPARPADALRGDPAPRRDGRHPLVRGRPDLRAALGERLRRRRRDRARRLLPGRPDARSRDGETDLLPARVPRHRHAPHADRAASLALEPRDRRVHRGDALRPHHGVPDDQRRMRGPSVPVHVQHDDRSRAGSSSTAS